MKRISIGTLIIALFVPLLVGGISAAISSKAMLAYATMSKPPLSPPAWLFPVAWTILYILMGLSFYFILVAEVDTRSKMVALVLFLMQLGMNFMWSIIFFNWGMYLTAFIWLFVMWGLILICAFKFYQISRMAAYLFIPYIVWVTFAAYLNFGSYILSMDGNY